MIEEPTNAETALAVSLAELKEIGLQTEALRMRALERLDEIRPLLIGKRVRAFGYIYQLSQVSIIRSNVIHGYGVRVSKKGKVGTRGYDIGIIVNWTFL